MSKARLRDVLEALKVVNLKVDLPESVSNYYDVNNEVVKWCVSNPKTGNYATLEFHLFDDLGRPTTKLTDILYAVTEDGKLKLYFEKRNSANWRTGLAVFVQGVTALLA